MRKTRSREKGSRISVGGKGRDGRRTEKGQLPLGYLHTDYYGNLKGPRPVPGSYEPLKRAGGGEEVPLRQKESLKTCSSCCHEEGQGTPEGAPYGRNYRGRRPRCK